jgi:hypothetical protein
MFAELQAQNSLLSSRITQLEQPSSAPPSPPIAALQSMWDEPDAAPRRPPVADFSAFPTKPSAGAVEALGHAPPPEAGKAVLIIGLNSAACRGITAAAASELRRRFVDLDAAAAAIGGDLNQAQADAVRGAAAGELGADAAEGALLLVSAGVLQSEAGRAAVAAWGISVHVEHHLDDLVAAHELTGAEVLGSVQLEENQSVAELSGALWAPLQECTKFTFTVCKGQAAPDNAETARDLLFFLRFICGVPNRER